MGRKTKGKEETGKQDEMEGGKESKFEGRHQGRRRREGEREGRSKEGGLWIDTFLEG